MKPIVTTHGYCVVCIHINNRQIKQFFIHRLVAIAFIPNPDSLPFINHKDENKINNCADNLEWCTAKYNVNYGNCIQKITKSQKKHPVNVYRMNGDFVCMCESVMSASRLFDIPLGNVSGCLAKKQGYAKGYVFRYVDDIEGNKKENIIVTDRHKRENTNKRRKVRQYSIDGLFIAEYISMEEAYRKTSIRATGIGACCQGKYKTSGGYKWKYV